MGLPEDIENDQFAIELFSKERNPDVGIWVSHRKEGKWTDPVEVANGIVNDSLRYACWNPVLYNVPNGDLLLFYKAMS